MKMFYLVKGASDTCPLFRISDGKSFYVPGIPVSLQKLFEPTAVDGWLGDSNSADSSSILTCEYIIGHDRFFFEFQKDVIGQYNFSAFYLLKDGIWYAKKFSNSDFDDIFSKVNGSSWFDKRGEDVNGGILALIPLEIVSGQPPLDIIPTDKHLSRGVFWVLTDSFSLDNWSLLAFDIPCDSSGNISGSPELNLNSKKGNSYNHRKLWEEEIKSNSSYRPYNKKEYNHYPRGRVEVSNNKATIFLNHHINLPEIVEEIKTKFGLSSHNISEVNMVVDGSVHYQCFLDKE